MVASKKHARNSHIWLFRAFFFDFLTFVPRSATAYALIRVENGLAYATRGSLVYTKIEKKYSRTHQRMQHQRISALDAHRTGGFLFPC